MVNEIRKVCVIGAGNMGSGIAAQIANAGVPVLLLDIVPADAVDRDVVAKTAVERMTKTQPAPLMSSGAAALIETGNIADHLDRVAECDWIVEAVIERLDIKHDLYARIEKVKRPGTAVSSNTSSIPLSDLVEGRSDGFKRDFLITHFFNPPRYMRLLEIVAGGKTDPAIVEKVEAFTDRCMGKTVVHAHDTPGFIANRIGNYWSAVALGATLDLGLTVEETDQIAGKPMGVPKTALFGLLDLVGIDLVPLVFKSLSGSLPPDDAFNQTVRPLPIIDRMIADGFTGRKGKGGFYRTDRKSDGEREALVIDFETGEYRAQQKPEPLPAAALGSLAQLVDTPGKVGQFGWTVISSVVSYAASLVGTIADELVAIDDAMKLGFNWERGPFELSDRLGPGKVAARMRAEGRPVPDVLDRAGDCPFYRVEQGRRQYLAASGEYADLASKDGVLLLADVKLAGEPIIANESARLWDIGDGVAALEFTTKMNVIDGGVIEMIERSVERVGADYKAMIIYSEAPNFSAGADLSQALAQIRAGAWEAIEQQTLRGQLAFKALKYASFPVVAAPAGLALGGGCEVCLHAHAIQAHAETYMGLVEVGVGIIPGWGGCGEMLTRFGEAPGSDVPAMAAASKAFELIATARVSKSAADARDMGVLRSSDRVTMNRDRLLADAKQRALDMVHEFRPTQRPVYRLPGEAGHGAIMGRLEDLHAKGLVSDYDLVVGSKLARVLTGGTTDPERAVAEGDMLALEREALIECAQEPRSQARMEHMLQTGKPLRN